MDPPKKYGFLCSPPTAQSWFCTEEFPEITGTFYNLPCLSSLRDSTLQIPESNGWRMNQVVQCKCAEAERRESGAQRGEALSQTRGYRQPRVREWNWPGPCREGGRTEIIPQAAALWERHGSEVLRGSEETGLRALRPDWLREDV